MTLTMRPDLLPHEARHVILYGPSWCGECCCRQSMVMCDKRRGTVGSSRSRHSMYSTCRPQDIISLATPTLGGWKWETHNDPNKWKHKDICSDLTRSNTVKYMTLTYYLNWHFQLKRWMMSTCQRWIFSKLIV